MDTPTNSTEDMNLVALWLKWSPLRLLAGAMAGLFSGSMMLLFAMLLSHFNGNDIWLPIKYGALPFLGNSATEAEFYWNTILIGLAFHEILAVILGVVFAHVTGTNSLSALLGMGLVWGVFLWIFIHNLFTPSIPAVFAAQISAAATFPIALVFGVSLVSVAFFDRLLKRDKKSHHN